MYEQGAKVLKNGNRIEVKMNEIVIFTTPIHHVTELHCFGNIQITTQVMKLLFQHNINSSYLSQEGNLLGRSQSYVGGIPSVRKEQLACIEDKKFHLIVAKILINAKATSMLSVLNVRRHKNIKVSSAQIEYISHLKTKIDTSQTKNQLSGIEGMMTKAYYSCWIDLLPSEMSLEKRTRRPAHNEVNALLNYFYTRLTNQIISIIESHSLLSCLGHLHSFRINRASLALDIIEPFRSIVVDKWIIKLIRRKEITMDNFYRDEGIKIKIDELKRLNAKYKEMLEEKHILEKVNYVIRAYRQLLVDKEYRKFEEKLQRTLTYLL